MCRSRVRNDISVGIVLLIQFLHLSVSQDCTLPAELWGSWTSTNLGTIVISGVSPSLTFTQPIPLVPSNDMECRFIEGSQYILQSKELIPTFSTTDSVFMWMCIEFRRSSSYSYNYYLNSPKESGFSNYRLVGVSNQSTSPSDICTETQDSAEFYTMIKIGHEMDAVNTVQCPDVLLGSYSYTYTDSSGTSCENSTRSFINSCDNANKTHLIVNNTDCTTVTPFYSDGGELGCIASIFDSSRDVYYISLYNLDISPATQFVCIAARREINGTVYISTKQTECEAGQIPTALPSGGATMILTPSCLDSQRKNWTWLYILLPCLGVLIIFILGILLLRCWLKKKELIRARRKEALSNGDHPLGEVSLKLDAPASLGMQHGYIDRKRDLLEKPPRRRMSEDREDLFGEQSLDLNLETETWTRPRQGKPKQHIGNGFSGAIIDGSNSSGSRTKLQPNGVGQGHKARDSDRKPKAMSTISGRFRSMTKNFLTTRMAVNNIKSRPKSHGLKSYERSTLSSTNRGPNFLARNGVHPATQMGSTRSLAGSRAPSRTETKAVSRPISKTGSRPVSRLSRRGSIDNLILSRNGQMPRSKTMVLHKTNEEKKPDIYTMPEEYVIEGGPNEVVPVRPPPVTGNILRDAYRSSKGKTNISSFKKPMASKKPWH